LAVGTLPAAAGKGMDGPWVRRWPRGWVWAVALALVLLRTIGLSQLPPQPAPGDPVQQLGGGAAAQGPSTRLEGRLLADPRPSGDQGACRVLLQLPQGRTELRFGRCPVLQEGWWLQVKGQLRRPEPAPHPLLAGPAERLAREGAFSQLEVEQHSVLLRPATPLADLRRRLSRGLQAALGEERGGVLAALVLGSAVVPLPAELREAFRASGLSHALAASGFHLTVLLGALRPLVARLGAAGRLAAGLAAIGAFVLLAGPQPSVLRAALMAAVALLVLEAGGRSRPLGLLALTVGLLLLWRPTWLLDVGFQLSVVATAALVVQAPVLERQLRGCLPAGFAAALAVPLAASLWTLPLQMLHFGVVPIYAVPANLLAAPLLTPLTLAAMVLALVALLLPPLLPLLAVPCGWLCALLLTLVRVMAALPLAQWQLGRPAPALVLLLAVGLLALVLPGLPRLCRRLAPALLALTVVLHLAWLTADQLLLVHQGRRDLLLARHQGRAVLVSGRADGLSCAMAAQLGRGLGAARFDWVLLLDPLPPDPPGCWQQQAGLVLASGNGSLPLLPGQRLASPGLEARPLSIDSRGLELQLGRRRWLLLPDPQALWAWRDQPQAGRFDGVWLGFRPNSSERRWLAASGLGPVWLSGVAPAQAPPGWSASGRSGSLQQALG
jgi:competence protein ComEC